MQQRRSFHLLKSFLLSALVLCVAGSAICSVAASAAAQERGAGAAVTAAP